MSKAPIARIYTEKRPGFDTKARAMTKEFQELLMIDALEEVRLLYRYDFEEPEEHAKERIIRTVFSEPNVDQVFSEETFLETFQDYKLLALEFLPGQYDQQADSASQCIQLVAQDSKAVKVATIYALKGDLTPEALSRIEAYVLNPVDSRRADLSLIDNLHTLTQVPDNICRLAGFTALSEDELESLRQTLGLAMSSDDLLFVQDYFRQEEKRDPSLTEIRVIDTYWSDHCRHTTFQTNLESIVFEEGCDVEEKSYAKYLTIREKLYEGKEKPVTLMDLGVIGAKALREEGYLEDLDASEEINACSINITVDEDGEERPWLLMFKNETHNHPTEIEPFGGAATCLGGAIRDPLSGRAYVYQAMRLTGSWDPRERLENTLKGKLSQRKISKGAADGYSSYGNQIGLATGQVQEVYHPGFLAKRMEVGAVIAAAPKENVVREVPTPGDIILLIGGKTGRDGCGGATGSSIAHTESSIETSGAQVQKGNPVEERKIQRLFRDPELARRIKRCNDFGAGGVSVAIGELAESLEIELDRVPKKYEGLDGTELAISESQERMAVVVSPEDVEFFIQKGHEENLEVTPVAKVYDHGRLIMRWRGDEILNLSRAFLDTNGAKAYADVVVKKRKTAQNKKEDSFTEALKTRLSDLNTVSQKGLAEMFDSTIGAGSVLMPFGGDYQLTPQNGMVGKIPVLGKNTTSCSGMSFGYVPYICEGSPYLGASQAVVESLSKLSAMGFNALKARLSFQEYFESLGKNPEKWGKPFAALLGALSAQIGLKTAAIGGKDSMSGTFEELTVPPSLISFAVAAGHTDHIVSAEIKAPGHSLYMIEMPFDEEFDYDRIRSIYAAFYEAVQSGDILAAKTASTNGALEAAALMSFGNQIGVNFTEDLDLLTRPQRGAIVFEANAIPDSLEDFQVYPLGTTAEKAALVFGEEEIELNELTEIWESGLRSVYPEEVSLDEPVQDILYDQPSNIRPRVKIAKPRVLIPTFPGSNCEYDMKHRFDRAGASSRILVFKNQNLNDIQLSVDALAEEIEKSQIIALPGGFSAGDQPDGSGKFIAAVFRNPKIHNAVMRLLKERDGLMIGICNGFQALIKLGLLPYGEILELTEDMPTLTYNAIGRHVSTIPRTKVVSNQSPWMQGADLGGIYHVPMSHGEGRFYATDDVLKTLIKNGQIATQYVDFDGHASMDGHFNPNGSRMAIEGITSPDGRILGKMGHSERIGEDLYQNIQGEQDQKIFESGVKYFQ